MASIAETSCVCTESIPHGGMVICFSGFSIVKWGQALLEKFPFHDSPSHARKETWFTRSYRGTCRPSLKVLQCCPCSAEEQASCLQVLAEMSVCVEVGYAFVQ